MTVFSGVPKSEDSQDESQHIICGRRKRRKVMRVPRIIDEIQQGPKRGGGVSEERKVLMEKISKENLLDGVE